MCGKTRKDWIRNKILDMLKIKWEQTTSDRLATCIRTCSGVEYWLYPNNDYKNKRKSKENLIRDDYEKL